MPLLDYKRLNTIQEYRRAFLILCMVSHSYVWGKHEPTSEVGRFTFFCLTKKKKTC